MMTAAPARARRVVPQPPAALLPQRLAQVKLLRPAPHPTHRRQFCSRSRTDNRDDAFTHHAAFTAGAHGQQDAISPVNRRAAFRADCCIDARRVPSHGPCLDELRTNVCGARQPAERGSVRLTVSPDRVPRGVSAGPCSIRRVEAQSKCIGRGREPRSADWAVALTGGRRSRL